jgi:hypothetical protein
MLQPRLLVAVPAAQAWPNRAMLHCCTVAARSCFNPPTQQSRTAPLKLRY